MSGLRLSNRGVRLLAVRWRRRVGRTGIAAMVAVSGAVFEVTRPNGAVFHGLAARGWLSTGSRREATRFWRPLGANKVSLVRGALSQV
jgi:hypothetical protein